MDRSYRVDGPVVCLIGSGAVPVQCAKMLVAAGFDVAAVHSPDAPLLEWATANDKHSVFPEFAEFRRWAETTAYDYLFSIINFRILPPSLIRSPQILAINYHDAPLPKYAGSHAIEWALANRESQHGITWHVMTDEVDAGDILKQVIFPITGETTPAQLRQRCYLTAMRAFRELIAELLTGHYTRVPQDLTKRTYYPRSVLPSV